MPRYDRKSTRPSTIFIRYSNVSKSNDIVCCCVTSMYAFTLHQPPNHRSRFSHQPIGVDFTSVQCCSQPIRAEHRQLAPFLQPISIRVGLIMTTAKRNPNSSGSKNHSDYAEIPITRSEHWFWSIWPGKLFGLRGVHCTDVPIHKLLVSLI